MIQFVRNTSTEANQELSQTNAVFRRRIAVTQSIVIITLFALDIELDFILKQKNLLNFLEYKIINKGPCIDG
jgi:hypothetical protein